MYPRFNRELAIHFGFPYDLSFTELVKYEKIGLQERLDHAAKIGDTRIAKKLLELGARGHYHAMYSAVREGHKEIIELLLPSYNNNNYNAVMTMATELGREDIIKWVLEIKANDSRKQRETWNRRRMSR
jgi:ankyrin repeat protein